VDGCGPGTRPKLKLGSRVFAGSEVSGLRKQPYNPRLKLDRLKFAGSGVSELAGLDLEFHLWGWI